MSVQLDLGVSDVHIPSATDPQRKRAMAKITSKTRNALPAGKFALPAQRKYPIEDAAHVRNAASRLEQQHKAGKISSTDYATAKRAIARAAKRFGIDSEFGKRKPAKGRALHVRADLAVGGSLHVRHMTDADGDRTNLESVCLTLGDDNVAPVWIQIAKPGRFVKNGKPFELNANVFSDIIRNFNATANHEIPVDYEHASHADASEVAETGAPAQGWIREMKVENNRLFGLVHWNDRAREQIRAGEYRYFSPVVVFGAKSRTTGEPIGAFMPSGAMTNVPFLDGLTPLAAKDDASIPGEALSTHEMKAGLAHAPSEYMPRLKASMKLHELSTAQECSDHLGKLRDHFDAAGGDASAQHEGVNLADYLHPLRDLVGASPGATWDEVFDIVQDLIDAAMEKHELEYHDAPPSEPGGASMTFHPDGSITLSGGNSTLTCGEEPSQETDDMSAEKIAELTISLKDSETKRTTAETKLSEVEAKAKETAGQIAELTLSLKDETAKREAAEAEAKTLKDEKVARDEKDLTDRVTLAFDTYKDTQKLVDEDKEMMLLFLTNKPESFEKKYPKVDPDKAHLLKNLSEKREESASNQIDDGAKGGKVLDFAATAKTFARQHGISVGEAQMILAKASSSSKR